MKEELRLRYKENRHELNKPHSALFIISFLCVFASAAALGSLRLYGLYLEHRISETAGRIEKCVEQNAQLSRSCSELLSPARVYSIARERLGMFNAESVPTIVLDGKAVMLAKADVVPNVKKDGFLEMFNPFVKKAHAEN